MLPGSGGKAYIKVVNAGTAALTMPLAIRVYASTDSRLDASDLLLGITNLQLDHFGAGKSVIVKVRLAIPLAMSTGRYRLVAEASGYSSKLIPSSDLLNPVDPNVVCGASLGVQRATATKPKTTASKNLLNPVDSGSPLARK